ncbi:MAG TPA: glycosyltransferase [Actinomycetota bacterium]|nr:glycosyltransferase [Actinomycetota bacterium]
MALPAGRMPRFELRRTDKHLADRGGAIEERRATAIIPAFNEEATVDEVVRAAQAAELVDQVLVVDNASTDATADVAAAAGAKVLHNPIRGKGESMKVGVDATDADVIVFLDADLLGLKPRHIDALVKPVLDGEADMVCGLFDRGPFLNTFFLKYLPVLTGERAVRRRLFEHLDMDDLKGYKVEASLNAACADLGMKRIHFVCDGMWHLVKEKKFRNPVEGFVRKVLMLGAATWAYLYYMGRHRMLPWAWKAVLERSKRPSNPSES